jgi:hypothetical protein
MYLFMLQNKARLSHYRDIGNPIHYLPDFLEVQLPGYVVILFLII